MVYRASVAVLIAIALAAHAASAAPAPAGAAEGMLEEIALGDGERALVLHFWATWCPACVEELPALAAALDACRGASVRVLAVNVGESPEEATRFLAEHGISLPLHFDPRGRAWRRFGVRALPANVVLRPGETTRTEGPSSAEQWRSRLAELGCRTPSD